MGSSTKPFVFDEKEWVVRISRTLDEELEGDIDIPPVSIFNVPKPLLHSNPHSYVPQQIALGPYNGYTTQHCEMERYKIAAARRMQLNQPDSVKKLHHLVDEFQKHDLRIRARYQRYVDLNCDTLAWIMALDACFLLEFLRVFAVKEEGNVKDFTSVPSTLSHFIDTAGKKSAHNTILRDVVMLENQIPLFLLRRVLEFQLSSLDSADELLISMLIGFCNEISPFKGTTDWILTTTNADQVALLKKCAHLLDFLYHTIVPKFEEPSSVTTVIDTTEIDAEEEQDDGSGEGGSFKKKSGNFQNVFGMICMAFSYLNKLPVQSIKRFAGSKPFQVISTLPTTISNLSRMKSFEKPIDNMLSKAAGGGTFERPPLMEEIVIPSVAELSKAGVKFLPTYTGIFSINFDVATATFYLPMVTLDVNSEIVLRNLVAYEACSASGPMVFTRYTELMNGIIDTDEDVKILRKNGIIVNHFKSDKVVTELWNGMSRSIRLTKVDFLDKTIGEVNKYYNGRWNIKVKKFVTRYVFESWKILTLFATLLMLLFTGVQAFCSVYTCPGVVNRIQNLHG
ncbi:OLC1v1014622C1 [Oldenlandia corymbosa var. corymbosa]|uniref:OLC1v1014622C1 n=1 Tax=Oldenlandia corymbosa var. corymbosa TaxID=529605 RepID=A0AAV1E3M9_OLDCO|nr:OLC1v1014622C1 [Oldenlandia corymbosa var. corymbosa]